ncbi:MAG TPA: hypothetical protein VKT82_28890 [Ktedonobacterales bacterium]|nr:hypothetical protein [Ktedonobacterales bacterium]
MIFIKHLVWDDWNKTHIARHNVTPDEVEEMCQADPQTDGAKKGRIRVTGKTSTGRIISAFLDPESEEGVYYTVSCRDASKKERRAYETWIKGGEAA